MTEKKCPKCGERLEKKVTEGLPAEEFPEEERDLGYKCEQCDFWLSTEDYNKL